VESDNIVATAPARDAGQIDGSDLAELIAQLRRHESHVARMIASATRDEVREYMVFADAARFAEVIADTEQHLETFARCAPSGRMPGADELSFIADLARVRAAAGFPLEAMLQAFRVGHRVLWDWLIAQVDDERKGDVALAITPFMHEYLGIVTRRLTETYVGALQTFVADADKIRRDLFEALLRGDGPARTEPLAQTLGLALDIPYVVIVAAVDPPASVSENGLLRRAEEILRRRLLDVGVNAFPILRDDEVVLLIPWSIELRRVLHQAIAPAATSFDQIYGARLVAGGGLPCDGLLEIRRGYQEARLARERASITSGFITLADAPLYESLLALAGPAIQRRLPAWAWALAGDVGSPPEGPLAANELVRTLLVYCTANLSIERAARELVVHPNTVRYRLRRLTKLTGLDTTSFSDLVELVTTVRLLPTTQSGSAPRYSRTRQPATQNE
jgi:hypothetical protein